MRWAFAGSQTSLPETSKLPTNQAMSASSPLEPTAPLPLSGSSGVDGLSGGYPDAVKPVDAGDQQRRSDRPPRAGDGEGSIAE
jgi:hypothetical protein